MRHGRCGPRASAARTSRAPAVSGARVAPHPCCVLHTVLVWGLKPRHWVRTFFAAWAAHGGQTPPDRRAGLPWQMTAERKRQLAQPLPVHQLPCDRLPPARAISVAAHPSSGLGRCVTGPNAGRPSHGVHPLDLKARRRVPLHGGPRHPLQVVRRLDLVISREGLTDYLPHQNSQGTLWETTC